MKIVLDAIHASRCVLIVGQEEALRRKALREILSQSIEDEFDFETVLADQSAPDGWCASVGTAPFLSARRVLLVRNLLRIEPPANWGVMQKALPPTALLVLVGDEESSGEDSRSEKAERHARLWSDAVKKAGGVVLSASLEDPKKMKDVLKADAESLGKSMSAVALEALSEMCGGNYTRARSELDKLALFVGEQASIQETDVRRVVSPSREWNIFRLVDAVIAAQPGAALGQLKTLVGSTAKADQAATRTILPMLSRQFKLVWQARAALDRGVAPTSLKDHFPSKPNLATEKDWIQNRAIQSARKARTAGLNACLQELAYADAQLKGAEPGFSPMETLESLVMNCCRHMG